VHPPYVCGIFYMIFLLPSHAYKSRISYYTWTQPPGNELTVQSPTLLLPTIIADVWLNLWLHHVIPTFNSYGIARVAAGPFPLITVSVSRQKACTSRSSHGQGVVLLFDTIEACCRILNWGRVPCVNLGARVRITRCATASRTQLPITSAPPSIITDRTPNRRCRIPKVARSGRRPL